MMNGSTHTDKLDAAPTAEVGSSVESLREKITETITYHLAALYIASSDFPKKDELPNLEHPPFNNFGHQLLLDYKLLLRIVWQSVDNVQSALKKVPGGKKSTGILWGGGVAIVTLVILLALSSSETCSLLSIGGAALLGFVAYAATSDNSKEKKEAVANVRAHAIGQLINGNWELASISAERKINELDLVGDGVLDGDEVPVLIVLDNRHPFPGYGRLQAENLFVCRPSIDASEEPSLSTIKEIRGLLSRNIVDVVSKNEQQEVSFGEIVAIRGNSLHIDSPWLNEDKVPQLWLDRDKLDDAELIDKRVSVRTYFAVQVLLPEYMTVATFFVRPFMACNSAACQIAVATMGPLVHGTDYFRGRLMRYQMEKDGSIEKFTKESKPKKTTEKDEPSLAFRQLRAVRALGLLGKAFQSDLKVNEIEELSIYEIGDYSKDYLTEHEKVIKESVMWPGYLTATQNLREANSLTFTDDFFGKIEAIASVKTLYDQVARIVLDSLDALGFDISDYRDSEGNYSINAEKIDQLVLGERIQITQAKETEEAGSPQSSSGQDLPKGTKQ